jgi:hypothetical protein
LIIRILKNRHRSWQSRRILWTKDSVLFTKSGEDSIIDGIPLAEVECTEESIYRENIALGSNEADFKNSRLKRVGTILRSIQSESSEQLGISELGLSRLQIQIKTLPDGYNSGRTYYIRLPQSMINNSLSSVLTNLSKASRWTFNCPTNPLLRFAFLLLLQKQKG